MFLVLNTNILNCLWLCFALGRATMLERISDGKAQFWEYFERAFPKKNQQMKLDYGELDLSEAIDD